MNKLIVDKKVKINSGVLPVIRAKQSHMRQLFQNLISNSIKFQPKNEDHFAAIDIECIEDIEYFKIAFKENGIGIE